jgi:hypothetical protein
MDLCKYKNIFGEPNKGIHAYRLFDVAIIDVVFTFLGAFIIARIFKISLFYTCAAVFLSGIVAHRLFCVRTKIDRVLFSD